MQIIKTISYDESKMLYKCLVMVEDSYITDNITEGHLEVMILSKELVENIH